jgi:POT family proton-dependent oligopeptide transporter
MVGFFLLTISSIPISYEENGDSVFGSFAYPGFIIAITIIGLGTGNSYYNEGGIKALVSPMCADQLPKDEYIITKNGIDYIVDHDLTVQSVYNWFYWSINIGALTGQVKIVSNKS